MDSRPWNFRLAQTADIPQINHLINRAYRGESSRAGWTTEEQILGGQRSDEAMLGELLAKRDSVMLLAFDHGELTGCVHLERTEKGSYLGMLTVDPVRQSRGLGRQLLGRAEEWVRENWQAHSIEMTVISVRHELIAYYERRGYKPTGQKKDFPFHNIRFGVPKRHDFHLVFLQKNL